MDPINFIKDDRAINFTFCLTVAKYQFLFNFKPMSIVTLPLEPI